MTELHAHVSDDVADRFAAAAAERGTSTEDLVADVLTRNAPASAPVPQKGHRFSFIGVGSSGRGDLSERVDELLAQDFDR